MKIIALLPFKNEEWVLPSYIHNVSKVADEIIAIDDGSVDNSAKLLKDAGAKVYSADNLRNFNSGWSEGSIRAELLRLGRESNGTHFLCLDADEALSNNFVAVANEAISSLKPGQKIAMAWLALWKSYTHFRHDHTVWSNNWKDFVVCDDGIMSYNAAQHMHLGRTPGSNENTWMNLPDNFGTVLHFQFSAFNNFQLKQSWLRCSELIQTPGQAHAINGKYAITLLDQNVGLAEMPKEWYNGIPMPAVPNFDPDWKEENYVRADLLPGIMKYFDEYGPAFFKDLHIWHIPQLRERYNKEVGEDPL